MKAEPTLTFSKVAEWDAWLAKRHHANHQWPRAAVFEAWTKPELFQRWWAPKSTGMVIVSCEMDVRVGGGYRLEIRHPSAPAPMPFFGKYLEVTPNARLVWTNDESASGPITTVTFEEGGLPEQFDQLDELLAT